MKKILAQITFFLIMAQVYLYGAFGEKLKNSIATEVNSTGDIVMGVIHILVGVLWLILVWWAIPLFVLILATLSIFEYFDEDIYDILII